MQQNNSISRLLAQRQHKLRKEIEEQQQLIKQIVSQKQQSGNLEQLRKQEDNMNRKYKLLMREKYPFLKSKNTLEYLEKRLYQQGFFQKINRVNQQIDEILNSESKSRNSISSAGDNAIQDFEKKIQQEKQQKLKAQEDMINEQILKLEQKISNQSIYHENLRFSMYSK